MDDSSSSEKIGDEGGLGDVFEGLKDKYNIKGEYRKPAAFSTEESYFDGGNGKYPPDWGKRRRAILEYQDRQCARCRTEITEGEYNCHHYRPLSEGGTHELQNLVVLCLSCHKLIHPTVADLDGDSRDAPVFPASNADPRVATVRKPATQTERQRHLPELELLQLTSAEGENIFATSEATYAISPTDAIEARDNVDEILQNVGLLPSEKCSIRVINSEQSPLKGATVELTLVLGNHGTYTMEGSTDKYGEANFVVPEPGQASVTVRKDGFETLENDSVPIDSPPYEHTVTLSLTGTTAGNAAPTATEGTTSSSRRTVLALGVTALAGVGIGGFLFGDSTQSPSPEESLGSGSGEGTEEVSTQRSIPVLGEDWNFDTGTGAAIQSIESAPDRRYLSTPVGTVTALSAEGSEQWSADLQAESTEPLTVLQDAVIVAATGQIQALSIDTGDPIWEFSDLPSNREPSVAADERGVTFVDEGSDTTIMGSLDPATGEELWRTEIEGGASRPSHTENAILTPGEGSLRVYDRTGERTGTIDYPTGAENNESHSYGQLAIEDNRGYLTTGSAYSYEDSVDIRMHAFDVDAGTHLWTEAVAGSVEDLREFEPPTVTDGSLVYGIGYDIDTVDDSGVARWERSLDGSVTSMPVIANETVYVGIDQSEAYSILGLDAEDGRITSETSLEQSPVVYTTANSDLLVGTDSGHVTKFERPR